MEGRVPWAAGDLVRRRAGFRFFLSPLPLGGSFAEILCHLSNVGIWVCSFLAGLLKVGPEGFLGTCVS